MPCLATALPYFSMPLLRYARLGLSVQCLSDTILIIATARRYPSTPLQNYLCFATAKLIFSVPSPCLSMPTLVLAIQYLSMPQQFDAMPLLLNATA